MSPAFLRTPGFPVFTCWQEEMDYFIAASSPAPEVLAQVARIWNGNAVARHAFYPWTVERLSSLLARENGAPAGTLFTAHLDSSNEMIGFAYAANVREDAYPNAGVVEALLVDAPHRMNGVGSALLDAAVNRLETARPRPLLLDALGAWPFGHAFNTLADGSERSGIFLAEPSLYRLFRRAGFDPVRKSIVMRADVSTTSRRPLPEGSSLSMRKRTENTWLDRVFRGRDLFDHDLVGKDGRILSRAIFGLMEGESRQENQAIFSLFGVNTPFDIQRKGYAGINVARLLECVRDLGGRIVELHVYADNVPALALYRSLGFRKIAETMMMHKKL